MKTLVFLIILILAMLHFESQAKETKPALKPLAKEHVDLMRMTWMDGCMAGSIGAVVGITGVSPQKINIMFLGDICSKMAKEVFKESENKI